jgi:hypothetical protein
MCCSDEIAVRNHVAMCDECNNECRLEQVESYHARWGTTQQPPVLATPESSYAPIWLGVIRPSLHVWPRKAYCSPGFKKHDADLTSILLALSLGV